MGRETRTPNTLGKASRQQILEAAERLLRDNGYHALSTRRVADECGISVGNLTYHFPNKMFMVEEVMTAVCDRYEHHRPEVDPDKLNDPKAFLTQTVAWMLDDAVKPHTSGLFLEFWILAKHHDFGADIIERSYEHAIEWLVASLEVLFPEASWTECMRAAYFMLTASEGSVALFSRPYQRPVDQAGIIEFVVGGILSILGGKER
jgi:AcrR family transcriptional regulator